MSAFSPRQLFLLDEACKPIREAFGVSPYLVGTAADLERKTYRDVDVRLILDDEKYDALFDAVGTKTMVFLGFAIGEYIAARSGLPIDFQIQRATEANAKHPGIRNPIGRRDLSSYHGDGVPEDPSE